MSRVVNSRMETGGTDDREEDLKNDRKQKDGALPIWEGTVFFIDFMGFSDRVCQHKENGWKSR